ncbi:hypothetical protein M8J77_017842 [Diaphorina citri]|nr:hypothetical protein M8J77_017842 [Diaphorina citri]
MVLISISWTDNGSGAPQSKPGSAGSSTRDGAARLLQQCQKNEWPPVDQVLKGLEKLVAAATDDVNTQPLAGVADPITGMTPLMYAVKENRTSFVDRMIDLGCDVSARNNQGGHSTLDKVPNGSLKTTFHVVDIQMSDHLGNRMLAYPDP